MKCFGMDLFSTSIDAEARSFRLVAETQFRESGLSAKAAAAAASPPGISSRSRGSTTSLPGMPSSRLKAGSGVSSSWTAASGPFAPSLDDCGESSLPRVGSTALWIRSNFARLDSSVAIPWLLFAFSGHLCLARWISVDTAAPHPFIHDYFSCKHWLYLRGMPIHHDF